MDALVTSQTPYHRIVDGTLQVNRDGVIQSVDPAFCQLIGMTAQDLSGRPWTSLFHPFDLPCIQQALHRFKEQDEAHLTVRCVRSDGTVTPVYLHICRDERLPADNTNYFCLVLNLGARIDYTIEKMQYQRLFELSNDLLCVANTTGYFIQVNPACTQLLGYSREELLQTSYLEFIHPDDIDSTLMELRNLRSGVHSLNFENRYRCKDGSWRWLSWSTPGSNGDGLLYAVARDITEHKSMEEKLMLHAKFDFVSGLPSRGYLNEEMIRAMARVSRTGQYLALHLIQLEGLQQIIDHHGSDCGDDCVREFALRLRRALRANDFAARIDQSVFVILTEQDDRNAATQLPQRILSLIDMPLDANGHNLQVTAHLSHALYDESDDRDPNVLLQRAFANPQQQTRKAVAQSMNAI